MPIITYKKTDSTHLKPKRITPQDPPIIYHDNNKKPVAAIKIDNTQIQSNRLHIIGWCVGSKNFQLSLSNDVIIDYKIIEISRPDVSVSIGIKEKEYHFGFLLTANIDIPIKEITLLWTPNVQGIKKQLEFKLEITANNINQEQEEKQLLLNTTSSVLGKACLDHAGAVFGRYGLLSGWVVSKTGTKIIVSDAYGNERDINTGIRYQRTDIIQLFSDRFGAGTIDAGFIIDWPYPQKSGDTIRISLVDYDTTKHVLAELKWTDVPDDAVGYARWAFSVPTPPEAFNQRLEMGEGQFISMLINERNTPSIELQRPIDIWNYGNLPKTPQYSIIIPLYGRWDFIEHQILEFAKDPIFHNDAEIIYVIDDPGLITPIISETENLINYYQTPFKLVWGHRNRGFSGASNLGASIARGNYLLFLNSDAFPTKPGWIETMGLTLDENPDFGIIGSRLIFADGGLQHAGMEFFFSTSWNVWLNKHPRAGLDPSLDPAQELIELPAVTGACMIMHRNDFETVGGFDQGYLIGDFEDSDLCMKVRAIGMKVGYLPTVTLTHLERQSFKLLGDNSFRNLVVRFNAWRHHQRWGEAITALMTDFNKKETLK